ncbi:MAG: TIGR03560 family F420-dependent LLM class oxidoreductase [Anaerolineaceae bacterium]|nr:TIGR03560 family F420-dependent LLM class oxidoreductase [Anaerolineaceae bacterium]
MTQIGLMLEGQAGLTWERWQRILKAAEDYGFQCVFRSDHYTTGDTKEESLEAWVSLTYAASHTSRIEFGTCVSPVTFRQPAMLTRMAAAIDDLSGGRLILGLGVGWNELEHKQFGVPFYDKATRFEMFEDGLEVTTKLLKSDTPVSYSGKHFSLDDALLLPRPQRPGGPRLMIGGNGPTKTLPLVAKYADEWNAVFLHASELKEREALLDRLLAENGRKPADVKRSLMTRVLYGKTDAEVQAKLEQSPGEHDPNNPQRIIGTGSAVVDQIGKFVEAGVERFMLQWLELDDIDAIESLAKEVLPHFHK